MVIGDLITDVIEKLRGRTDAQDRIPVWIRNAIIDLTQDYPFEELSVKGPLKNFEINRSEYPPSFFMGTQTTSFTRILSWFVYFNQTGSITRGVDTGYNIKGRALQVVEPMSNIPGIPTFYAQQGKSNLVVGYMPNAPYVTYVRWQREHPFDYASDLSKCEIFMPTDWREILVYAAAVKGCERLGMYDISKEYNVKLFGDPKGEGEIGLIKRRTSQQRRNLTNNERQLQPVVRRMCR